jgi:hypothetical protein
MSDTLAPLILDFLQWLAAEPRPYSAVMDTWRTSCPRFTVWEDAVEMGFVVRSYSADRELLIDLSPRGRGFLEESGRALQPRAL